jgi:hypothetical protein
MSWRGPALAGRTEWMELLAAEEVEELRAAARKVAGRPLLEVTAEDAPLPALGRRLAGWRAELTTGRGFLLARGVPVEDGDEAAATMLWILGRHLGTPIRQNAAGDLLGHVVDTGAARDDPMVRKYQTSDRIRFHVDLGDAVALLCLRPGRAGGASRIASSLAISDEIARRRPDLVAVLHEPFPLDRRNEQAAGEPSFVMLPICHDGPFGRHVFFHADYFGSVERLADAPRLRPEQREVLALFEELAESPEFHLDMDFRPGDVQLLANRSIVHARTAYEDAPGEPRHLLRLWLVFPPRAGSRR